MTSPSRRNHRTTARTAQTRRTAIDRLTKLSRLALVTGALTAGCCGLFSTSAFADESVPRAFVPEGTIKEVPLDWTPRDTRAKSSAFDMTSEGNTLRWRVKQPKPAIPATIAPASATATIEKETPMVSTAQALTPVEAPVKETKPTVAKTEGKSRLSLAEQLRGVSRVRKASALDDPFGDGKRSVLRAQAVESTEDENAAPADLNPAGRQPAVEAEETETPAPPRTIRSRLTRQPVAPPAEMEEMKEMKQDDPIPDLSPAKPNAQYYDRDCALDGKACEAHRERIKADMLMSKPDLLNITPTLTLPNDSAELVAQKKRNFARAPSRVWLDRNGDPVATGRLVDVRNQLAHIEGENGPVKVRLIDLGDDELCFLSAWRELPTECQLAHEQYPGRNFCPSTMTFTASALCHKPAYFEETQVERYGHTAGFWQPAISGAHFFVNLAVLPYKMGINPPNECQYVLGYYRPGSCAPWMVPPVPLSVRGAAAQAGAVLVVSPLIP